MIDFLEVAALHKRINDLQHRRQHCIMKCCSAHIHRQIICYYKAHYSYATNKEKCIFDFDEVQFLADLVCVSVLTRAQHTRTFHFISFVGFAYQWAQLDTFPYRHTQNGQLFLRFDLAEKCIIYFFGAFFGVCCCCYLIISTSKRRLFFQIHYYWHNKRV